VTALATVFGLMFAESFKRLEALLMGLAGNITEPDKFIRWNETSGGL